MSYSNGETYLHFHHLLQGNEAEFSLGMQFPGTEPTTDDLITITNEAILWWTNYVSHVASHELALIEVVAKSAAPGLWEFANSVGCPVLGLDANPAAANQVALVTTFYTAVGGRSGRGRAFMPGCSGHELSGGLWGADLISAMNSAWAFWLAGHVPGDSWVWSVISKHDTDSAPVNSYVARVVPGGINRRRIGRGS